MEKHNNVDICRWTPSFSPHCWGILFYIIIHIYTQATMNILILDQVQRKQCVHRCCSYKTNKKSTIKEKQFHRCLNCCFIGFIFVYLFYLNKCLTFFLEKLTLGKKKCFDGRCEKQINRRLQEWSPTPERWFSRSRHCHTYSYGVGPHRTPDITRGVSRTKLL